MSLSRISSRLPRIVMAQCRNSLIISTRRPHHHRHNNPLPIAFNQLHSLVESQNKVCLLHHSALNASALQQFRFSSVASPETTEKENSQSGNGEGTVENDGATAKTSGDAEVPEQKEASSSEDLDEELTMEDLVKLVTEKEDLLKAKHKEIEKMQDKVLRTYADMENVMDRARRDSENSKKFAIQSFAKGLLDVADNLARASSVAKDSFSKIDASQDTAGAVPLLKTLLEGVEMTEKQLIEVFKKFGVVRYDPTNEQFDPNRHDAVFQVPDASKPPGTIAVVLKAGYVLHDRVIRPAEVGVTQAVDNKETDQGSEA